MKVEIDFVDISTHKHIDFLSYILRKYGWAIRRIKVFEPVERFLEPERIMSGDNVHDTDGKSHE